MVRESVTMNWDAYEVFHPGVAGPLHTVPRAQARQAFNRLMDEKPARIAMLHRLLNAHGVELATNDEAIQELNDWFRVNVEADPNNPGRLLPEWYSVVNDVALFLGDVMIERSPGLRWEFFTGGKKDVAYQRHVIMGFRRVANPKFNIDIDGSVAGYAHRIIARRGSIPRYGVHTVRGVEIDVDFVAATERSQEIERDAFLRWLKEAESRA